MHFVENILKYDKLQGQIDRRFTSVTKKNLFFYFNKSINYVNINIIVDNNYLYFNHYIIYYLNTSINYVDINIIVDNNDLTY